MLEKQGHDLNHKLWTAKLLETNPESIMQAHYSYLESGAQCITTSSYQASVPGFMAMGHSRDKAEILIRKTVELADIAIERAMAKGIVDHRPLIAASIGPYGAYLADGSEYRGDYGVSDDTLREFHLDRIGLLDEVKGRFLCLRDHTKFSGSQGALGNLRTDRQTCLDIFLL